MNNLDFNLSSPDISPALKLHHFIPSTPCFSSTKDSSHLNLCHYRFYIAFGLELRVDHRMVD
ncbi:hypothetical protein CXB51_037016 [Gossypium anomalum]|uniref:Uncharacterized protein n=1 Tax=Gossypium anomalum TaxID=47600 RepID=A0A8J5XZM4_9ROSI|nr:hypothetical protein CXB51_037016 [Gossypium anomalum]